MGFCRPAAVFSVIAATGLAGCGNDSGHSMGGGSMPGMDMGGAKSAKAILVPNNIPSGGGTATVAVANGQVHVDVRLRQLSQSTKFTVHLHKGACTASRDLLKTVGEIQSDADGAGAGHLEYAGTELPMPAFVDVHPTGSTDGPILCGDLKAA
jgi:hypothetical protein